MSSRDTEPVHWVGDAPTRLHGVDATGSFARTTGDAAEVTCGLCLSLLALDPPAAPVRAPEMALVEVLAGIRDALTTIAERLPVAPPVEPGPCWHDPGITWPGGYTPRCELRAGHAGAHECDRGALGGVATWPAAPDEAEAGTGRG